MLMEEARKEIIRYGKEVVDRALTKGSGGNISAFDPEKGLMAITATGAFLDELGNDDLVVTKLDGTIVEGKKKPSSEWTMHKIMYERRDDLKCLIHAHTTYSTVVASLRQDLPPAHYMLAVAGKKIRCADYASYGSEELAENAFKAMEGNKAVLLANHGVLAGAQDMKSAFNIVEEVEYCAKIYVLAKAIGDPVIIDEEEMGRMVEKFKSYGQV